MARISLRHKPALTLVEDHSATAEWSWFCGHCAAPSASVDPPSPTARVCSSCGFGLLLESRREMVPDARDAFVVIDSSLQVHGVSMRAEILLGVTEEMAINRPVAELLVPADAEAQGPSRFAAAVAEAR